MADAIPPTPPTLTLPAPGGGGPVAVSVVAGNADVVLKMLDGALLEAEASARAAKGLIELTTADGTTLQLKAPPGIQLPPIPAGAKLLLQKLDGQLTLVAINGRTLGGALPPAAAGLPNLPTSPAVTPQAAPLAGAATTPSVPPQAPLGLPATILKPATEPPPPGATAGLPPDLPAGTRLTVRIVAVQPPGPSQPAPPTPAATPGATPIPQPAPTPTIPGAAPQPAAVPQPQAQVPAGVPGQILPDALPRLPGTVLAHPPSGSAVVQTPVGTLSVPTHGDLPTGTQMVLEVVGEPLPPLAAAAPQSAAPSGLTPQGWPALSQALEVLATADQPQALEQLLRVIPQPDTRLAAAMAAFGGALRSGEAKGLLPESSVRGIEKAGRKELASRLKADLEALDADSGRPVAGGEWRAYTMPFLSQGIVEPIRLFVRRAGEDGDGGKRAGGAKGATDERFILDFNLTRLGRLQLDGLVRREDKLFDLIIRSGHPFEPEMRRDILGIFTNASELVGTKGTVTFQSGGRWIEFPPAPPAPTRIEV